MQGRVSGHIHVPLEELAACLHAGIYKIAHGHVGRPGRLHMHVCLHARPHASMAAHTCMVTRAASCTAMWLSVHFHRAVDKRVSDSVGWRGVTD